jgi:hypothetical protein
MEHGLPSTPNSLYGFSSQTPLAIPQVETSHKPTLAEKKDYITSQLLESFPEKTTAITAIILVLIGLAAIALQAVLIVNTAVNYEIGNGIWGGCFAIISGFIKLNLSNIYF